MLITRKPKPKTGDIKKVKKFLILPRFTKNKIAWLGIHELTYEYIQTLTYANTVYVQESMWILIDVK